MPAKIKEELHLDSMSCQHCSVKIENEVETEKKLNIKALLPLISGTVIFVLAMLVTFSLGIKILIFSVSYLLIGGKILFKAIKSILKGQIFNENFLLSIATIGAFALKQFPEGVAVMLFYQVGEFLQDMAVEHSKKSIRSLINIRPDYANLKIDNGEQKVPPENVKIGDIITVKPGERIPLDGRVISGSSTLDTSALTGESMPKKIKAGEDILSGSVNIDGLLTVKVTKHFTESTVSKILDMVQNASSRKAPTEKFITKFARYYTPVIVFIAIFIAVFPTLFIPGAAFKDWISRSLVFLVISCPCALVISIPLGFFGGIGSASKKGILIKGSSFLEALNSVNTVVFDKTGTLTKGIFKVTKIEPQENVSEKELLEYAAFAESYSNHPIAASILKAYGSEINKTKIKKFKEILGHGVKVQLQSKEILAGNSKLMGKANISFREVFESGSIVYIAVNKKYLGFLLISDEIKEDSLKTIETLKKMRIKKLVMLTGDSESIAVKTAQKLGLDEVYSELLPHEKVEKIEALEKQQLSKGNLVFVGDGINDAPVLARADIGVAMGALGSDAAIEAADVVLMTDEPYKLCTAIKIARKTHTIVWQNIIFSIFVKVFFLTLGAFGVATMWEAVFADVGVALIAIINALRIVRLQS